ncbi:MAG TPA: hypothetical protein VGV86_12340 [Acidimicrobiales bacterium]|nr:hypothetical protein [Acidimicrobiales bacterium]
MQRRPVTVLAGSSYLFAKARRRVPPGTSSGKSIFALRGLVVLLHVVLFGPVQVLLMLVVHLVCYLGIMGMVNTVGHLYGRKPHPDVPGYDLAWLAIPLLGHGYHNSHHAHPAASRTGPLDPIWPLLRVLGAVGLVELADRPAQNHTQVCCNASTSASSRLQEASLQRF